jgi:hypothetical protein
MVDFRAVAPENDHHRQSHTTRSGRTRRGCSTQAAPAAAKRWDDRSAGNPRSSGGLGRGGLPPHEQMLCGSDVGVPAESGELAEEFVGLVEDLHDAVFGAVV